MLLNQMQEVDHQTPPVVSNTHWRLNFSAKKQINVEPEEEEEDADATAPFSPIYENVDIQFEILAVPGHSSLRYATFKRKGGAALLFYEKAEKYLKQLHLFNNATATGEVQ